MADTKISDLSENGSIEETDLLYIVANDKSRKIQAKNVLQEVYKHFDGDGSTTDFDCGMSINCIRVDIDGFMMSDNDFSKDDTTVSFNDAPDDGAEITVWILTL